MRSDKEYIIVKALVMDVVFNSPQSCAFVRGGAFGSASRTRLVWTKLPVCRLDILIVSPSRRLDDSEAPSPNARARRSARLTVSSLVRSSHGSLARMFSFSVGSRASTVRVQSVWFCSNLLFMLLNISFASILQGVGQRTCLWRFCLIVTSASPQISCSEHIVQQNMFLLQRQLQRQCDCGSA